MQCLLYRGCLYMTLSTWVSFLMTVTFSCGETLAGICACSFSVSQFRRASSSHSACILSQNSVSDCSHQREREREERAQREGRGVSDRSEWLIHTITTALVFSHCTAAGNVTSAGSLTVTYGLHTLDDSLHLQVVAQLKGTISTSHGHHQQKINTHDKNWLLLSDALTGLLKC